MDSAGVLDQYAQELNLLPEQVKFLLETVHEKDAKANEVKRRLQQKDAQIHKFIKQHGSLTKNPKEQQFYAKINEDFEAWEAVQREKCLLANTAVYMVAKGLAKLEADIEKLEAEGLLPPWDPEENDEVSDNGDSRESSYGNSLDRKRKSTSLSRQLKTKRIKSTPDFSSANSPGYEDLDMGVFDEFSNTLGNGEEHEDKRLYCYCHKVSYGEMVACDGKNCKIEWFHYGCVGLNSPPTGSWYCQDCASKLVQKQIKKRTV